MRLWSGSSGFSLNSLPLSSMVFRAGAEEIAKPGAAPASPNPFRSETYGQNWGGLFRLCLATQQNRHGRPCQESSLSSSSRQPTPSLFIASSSIPITMLSIVAKSYSEAGAPSWPSPTHSRRASTPTPVSRSTKRGSVPRGRLIPSRGRLPLRRSPRPLNPPTEEEEGGGGGGEEEEEEEEEVADDVSGQSTRCVATSRMERVH